MTKKHVSSSSKTGRKVAASRTTFAQPARRFTIGTAGMSKLNAVEGITQSASSRAMFADFEHSGKSAEERRRAIVAKHARKG
ncbi:MAG: hypothetical protein NTV73_16830 [Hyphomicrobiales bacterium]|nr:hypothetical protein [Hyphomicrobiales bacterium]